MYPNFFYAKVNNSIRGIETNDRLVDTNTSPATVCASASYLLAKRKEVTATGVDICNNKTENET